MWLRLSLEASQGWIQSAIKNSTTCSSLLENSRDTEPELRKQKIKIQNTFSHES